MSPGDGAVMPPRRASRSGRLRRELDLPAIASATVAASPNKKRRMIPSTRGGQPLELWYYAFDWAGPNVTQVMEILCTREQNGEPGRVVEITLAAPSL